MSCGRLEQKKLPCFCSGQLTMQYEAWPPPLHHEFTLLSASITDRPKERALREQGPEANTHGGFETAVEYLKASMDDEHDGSDTEVKMLPVEEMEVHPQSKRSSNVGADRGWMATYDEDRCESDAGRCLCLLSNFVQSVLSLVLCH
ncbi:unnamed protein product [Darwinula stevensoni]|uniref:Uncharacterized protein n=1 Tax=Darwinula stevensoni TaxID=69355 RepID=A0A7R9A1R0_9CRUS|nr:unnamed protein product [Darwinula stevensoni]CAG0878484.1 unnamed protein product [Darwinula stevensoni]